MLVNPFNPFLYRFDEDPFDLQAGGRSPGVHNPGDRVASLAGEFQFAMDIAVEPCAESEEILYSPRPFVDENPDSFDIAQSSSGSERVR